MSHYYFRLLIIVFLFLFSPLSFAFAQSEYLLRIDDVTTDLPTPTILYAPLYTPTPTPTPPLFIIFPDKQSQKSDPSLSVQASTHVLDFGTLTSTNPVKRTIAVEINSPSRQYTLLLYEDRSLTNGLNESIPETRCDNGACTHTNAALWSNTLTYGFGYRCDSPSAHKCAVQFAKQDMYKHPANTSLPQLHETILVSRQHTTAQITFKLNVAGTQSQGMYTNTLYFIAAPTL